MENENTKSAILENSISLFARYGYEAVGVQEICTVSNITKPTLYYYFGNKAGIIKSIADTKSQELLQTLSKAAAYQHDFINSLKKILIAESDFALNNVPFFTLHLILLNSPKNSEAYTNYQEVINQIDSIFLQFFTESANEIGNMKGKEKLYSILFHNNVNSVISNVLRGNLSLDNQTIHQIIHSFVYGVVA